MYYKTNTISKLFICLLVITLLFGTCSVTSFAYTDYVYSPSSFGVTMYNQEAVPNGSITDYTSTITTTSYSRNGISYTRFGNSNSSMFSQGYVKECVLLHIHDFSITHEYNLNFYSSTFSAIQYAIECNLVEYVNGTYNKITTLHYAAYTGSQSSGDNFDSFNFTLEGLNLTTNSSLFIEIVFQTPSTTKYSFTWGLSDVTLRDLDDDRGFFEQIIDWIRNVANNVTSIGSNIVNGLSGLGNNISSWISNLGTNISNWLTNVKDGIVNKLQSVQAAIINAIDGIQQWFVNLGNRIGDFFTMLKNYILYFQHPVTLNSDGVPVDGNGNPVYTNPFEDTLDSVSDTLDDWFDSLDDFILTIQSVNVQITGYLQTFTNIFNRFNAGVPIIGVIITLALIVIVIKKIMGR